MVTTVRWIAYGPRVCAREFQSGVGRYDLPSLIVQEDEGYYSAEAVIKMAKHVAYALNLTESRREE